MSAKKRKSDFNEYIRLNMQRTMSQAIARKDSDYQRYAGAYIDDVMKSVKIDFILRMGLLPDKQRIYLKALRYYLDLKRIGYFVTAGSDIFSKLGFILGDNRQKGVW